MFNPKTAPQSSIYLKSLESASARLALPLAVAHVESSEQIELRAKREERHEKPCHCHSLGPLGLQRRTPPHKVGNHHRPANAVRRNGALPTNAVPATT